MFGKWSERENELERRWLCQGKAFSPRDLARQVFYITFSLLHPSELSEGMDSMGCGMIKYEYALI
jgi:hypothetical protein